MLVGGWLNPRFTSSSHRPERSPRLRSRKQFWRGTGRSPLTISSYLRLIKLFEADLRACALLDHFFDPKTDPFYSSYNVGAYTFAPVKVVWKEIASEIEAAVLVGSEAVPDHKLVCVAFDQEAPAFFLAAFLNSTPVAAFVRAYAIQTSISGHIFDYAAVPTFDPENPTHRALADLGEQCSAAAVDGESSALVQLEQTVDTAVAGLLGIDKRSLGDPQQSVRLLRLTKRERERELAQ